ncbi:MAG TPA: chaperone modulator CbpM [Methylophilaceae bacterium]|nr:chaperone modulator CbpM [Methylophilaceae bacterium]
MIIDVTDAVWLDEQHEVSIAELAQLSGLTMTEIQELIDNGALVPVQPEKRPLTFRSTYIVLVKSVSRLRDAFELDTSTLSLTLILLERIRLLQDQLKQAATTAKSDRQAAPDDDAD